MQNCSFFDKVFQKGAEPPKVCYLKHLTCDGSGFKYWVSITFDIPAGQNWNETGDIHIEKLNDVARSLHRMWLEFNFLKGFEIEIIIFYIKRQKCW